MCSRSLHAGLSLAGYGLIFTSARILGSLALFILGFLMIRRYSDRLMAVLMAILIISGIDFRNQVAFVHMLIIPDVHTEHLAGHARTNLDNIPINEGVIRLFVGSRFEVVPYSNH